MSSGKKRSVVVIPFLNAELFTQHFHQNIQEPPAPCLILFLDPLPPRHMPLVRSQIPLGNHGSRLSGLKTLLLIQHSLVFTRYLLFTTKTMKEGGRPLRILNTGSAEGKPANTNRA